jgi:mevalonate kinase
MLGIILKKIVSPNQQTYKIFKSYSIYLTQYTRKYALNYVLCTRSARTKRERVVLLHERSECKIAIYVNVELSICHRFLKPYRFIPQAKYIIKMKKQTYYANGKLLLTGEYFVLDGATALALPTKFGQTLSISKNKKSNFTWDSEWISTDEKGHDWFSCGFDSENFTTAWSSGEDVDETLMTILKTAKSLNPRTNFSSSIFETQLTFPRAWGLGTSSTLIYTLAQYCAINPYILLEKSFGGSGYDLACAGAKKPILFQRQNGKPTHKEVDFNPPFKNNLYFVYLGKKQNSREGITRYREKIKDAPPQYFDDISALTNAFLTERDFKNFENLILEHEKKVVEIIELPRAKSLYFNDFWGEIKSLGAWGGDFILATSNCSFNETKHYFERKGFPIILTYEYMVL